jgi:hypothetical protein
MGVYTLEGDGREERTESGFQEQQSALALRRLTGAITLSPQKPEVGRPYYMARCKFDALDLLVEGGSNSLVEARGIEPRSARHRSRLRSRV